MKSSPLDIMGHSIKHTAVVATHTGFGIHKRGISVGRGLVGKRGVSGSMRRIRG